MTPDAKVPRIDDSIELPLDLVQTALFREFIEAQRQRESVAVFAVVAHSFDPQAGAAVIRLQVKSVPWAVGKKVVKLLKGNR